MAEKWEGIRPNCSRWAEGERRGHFQHRFASLLAPDAALVEDTHPHFLGKRVRNRRKIQRKHMAEKWEGIRPNCSRWAEGERRGHFQHRFASLLAPDAALVEDTHPHFLGKRCTTHRRSRFLAHAHTPAKPAPCTRTQTHTGEAGSLQATPGAGGPHHTYSRLDK
jgi:hypothetical protein